MKVLVVGATGGTGRQVTAQLLERGHEVTAFARQTHRLGEASGSAHLIDGDATDAEAVARAVTGQDAVVVTLGIAESVLRVRLLGPRGTIPDVRSVGTITVIDAMQQHGVARLVVQSSYGVGESRDRLGLTDRMIFRLLLLPQIRDTERQEQVVRASGLEWTIVQPVHLTDALQTRDTHLSNSSVVQGMRVTRQQVAAVLADAAETTETAGRTIAVSAAKTIAGATSAATAR